MSGLEEGSLATIWVNDSARTLGKWPSDKLNIGVPHWS